jgi:acyl-coenzyme A thioesterase PaaI-like protein
MEADRGDGPAWPWLSTTPWGLLEVDDWLYFEDSKGLVSIEVGLPDRLRNVRGQLSGGFIGTYVDFVALRTVAGPVPRGDAARPWLTTAGMQIEHLAPVTGPRFLIDSRVDRHRGRTAHVTTRFLQDGELAVFAHTRVRETRAAPRSGIRPVDAPVASLVATDPGGAFA